MKKVLIFGGIAIVLGAIAYFGYKAYKSKQAPASVPAIPSTGTAQAPSNGKPVVLVKPLTVTPTQNTVTARG